MKLFGKLTLGVLLLAGALGAAPPGGTAGGVGAGGAPTKPVDFYAMKPEEFFKRAEVKERIKKESADLGLLEAAIFQQSNVERVANKLPAFRHSYALQVMARGHSLEMAKLQYFEHESPVAGNRTLADRLRNVGLVNVSAGENIAVLPAKEMGSGEYWVRDNPDGTETWTDKATGKRIDYYTYEELAGAVLTSWMKSPSHRANMLNKAYVFLGTGAGRGPYDANRQDSFYMTQNFSGAITAASEAKAQRDLATPATAVRAP